MSFKMKDVFKFIEGVRNSPKISEESRNRLEDIYYVDGYAEPGYELEEGKILLLGNWNDAEKWVKGEGYRNKADDYVSRVAKVLEKRYNCELEWLDEWAICSDCYKAIRVHPDSFCWEPYYEETSGSWRCKKCAEDAEDS